MKILIGYTITTVSALFISIKHFGKFQLSFKEYIKYLKKSINLALCYLSFSGNNNFRSYKRVGEIAFFSSTYDIITDLKKYEPRFQIQYFEILRKKTTTNIFYLTEEMYQKDLANTFTNDGLERGAISLKIILLYIQSIGYFESKCNISELGEIMQITDDIIDYEEDKILNETNCFLSDKKNEYAQIYKRYFSNQWALKLFETSPVMNFIIKKSILKLDEILLDQPFLTHALVSTKFSKDISSIDNKDLVYLTKAVK